MIYKISTVLLVLVLIVLAVYTPRFSKDIKKKKSFENTYAIQNVGNGLCLRPLDAVYENGTPLIQYPLHNWECITWEMIKADSANVLLMNLYSERSFQPDGEPKVGTFLCQQSMDGTRNQLWQFLKQEDNSYLIRLDGSDLYITSPTNEENDRIQLQPYRGDNSQRWRIIRQTPWI